MGGSWFDIINEPLRERCLVGACPACHNANMENEEVVRRAFADQSVWCEKLGSPFTARLLKGLGEKLERNSSVGGMVLDWSGPPDAMGDSVPLRLAGALHALVRRGQLPELAGFYPPNTLPDIKTLTDSALAAIARMDETICGWLKFPPQTNEVARSGVIFPGLLTIAQETGLPLALFEVGASGGLNLIPDRYAYRLGDAMLGAVGSPLVLSPEWSGSAPLPVPQRPEISSRRGCDRNPLDVTDPSHRERLIAYIWADQPQRLARVKEAITLAQENPPQIEQADAADWVEENISLAPQTGVTRVLFHSIAFQYFSPSAQQRIEEHIKRAGARATADAPLAWLAFEQAQGQGPCLTLRLWGGASSGTGETRILAKANNAHCQKIEWLG